MGFHGTIESGKHSGILSLQVRVLPAFTGGSIGRSGISRMVSQLSMSLEQGY